MERNRGTDRSKNAAGPRNRTQPSNEDCPNFTGIISRRRARNTRDVNVQDSTVSSQTGPEFDTNTNSTGHNIHQPSRTTSNGESGNDLQIRFRNQRQNTSSSTAPSTRHTNTFRSRGGAPASTTTTTARNASRGQESRHSRGGTNTNANSNGNVRAGVSPKRTSGGSSSPRRGERRGGAIDVIPPSLRYRGSSTRVEENNPSHEDDQFDFSSLEPHFLDYPTWPETNSPLGSYLVLRGPRGLFGLGTEDHPFELWNDSSTSPEDPLPEPEPVPESEEEDAALALRLQQEEWNRVNTPRPRQNASDPPPSPYQVMRQAVHEIFHPRGAAGGREQAARRAQLLENVRIGVPGMDGVLPPDVMEMIIGIPPVVGAVDDDSYEALLDLQDRVGNVSRGLSRSLLDKLPVNKHTSVMSTAKGACAFPEDDLAQCSVCLAEYKDGEEKRMLPCKHELHKLCIDTWLENNTTCPVCRKDVRDGL